MKTILSMIFAVLSSGAYAADPYSCSLYLNHPHPFGADAQFPTDQVNVTIGSEGTAEGVLPITKRPYRIRTIGLKAGYVTFRALIGLPGQTIDSMIKADLVDRLAYLYGDVPEGTPHVALMGRSLSEGGNATQPMTLQCDLPSERR